MTDCDEATIFEDFLFLIFRDDFDLTFCRVIDLLSGIPSPSTLDSLRLLASRDDRFFTVAIDCLLGIADLEVADTL